MNDTEATAEQQRRRRTSQLLWLSGSLFVVFGIALVVLQVTSGGSQPTPNPSGSPTPTPTINTTQPTLLIRVAEGGAARGNLVTATTSGLDARASLLSLPDNVVVASRQVAPRELVRSGGATVRQLSNALAVTLGVRIDAVWQMDRKALAGLVDAAGGVVIEVPQRTVVRTVDGKAQERFRPGRQRLSGTSASWYAVGKVADESAAAAAQRFDAVMTTALVSLPRSETEVRETLTALGALSPTTVPTELLSGYLVELGALLAASDTESAALPVTEIGTGTFTSAWINYRTAVPLLSELFPDALWQAEVDGDPRVLVMAPADPPGVILSTRSRLGGEELEWVDGRGVAVEPRKRTVVQTLPPGIWGQDTAAALGLPSTAVTEVEVERSGAGLLADVDVTLGRDYRPGSPTAAPVRSVGS